MFNTPILLIVFNRPDTTVEVFNSVRQIKPKKLFIAADGPRANNEKDAIMCPKVKEIVSQVDWDCDVFTYYREENAGCAKNVSEAISWFFSKVEYGIILEDDTVPNQSFYTFCEQMLIKYKDEDKIKIISGTSYLVGCKDYEYDYYYSILPTIWGWATWKRAWAEFTFDIETVDFNLIYNRYKNKIYSKYIYDMINSAILNKHTWDTFWFYNVFCNDGISVVCTKNLVRNIGFQGTHYSVTPDDSYGTLNMPTFDLPIAKKIISPNKIVVNSDLDRIAIKNIIKLEGHEQSWVLLNLTKIYATFLKDTMFGVLFRKLKSFTISH